MTTVTEDLDLPSGVNPENVVITVYLAGENGAALSEAYNASTGKTIVGKHRFNPAADGTWSLDLDPNADLTPTGTVWARTVSVAQPGGSPFATVPATGGPYRWDQILASPPGALTPAALTVLENKFFTPHVSRSAAWGQRWFAARDEADIRQVNVHMWGGSVTDGSPGPTDPLTTSYAGRVEAALRAAYGDGGSGYTRRHTSSTGTWTDSPGFASNQATATAAASRQWTGLRGTEVKIYHRNVNITGTFRYQVDGGGFTNVTPPTGFGQEPGVITVGSLPDVPHTVDIEWVSGTIAIHGVRATYPTGIVTHRCAIGGRAYAQYGRMVLDQFSIGITNGSPTITCTAPGFFNSKMVNKYLVSESAGLPPDARITAVGSATSATIHANATATATITVQLTSNRPSDRQIGNITVNANAFSEGLGMPDLLIVTCALNDTIFTGSQGATGPNTPSADIFRDGLSSLLRAYYGHHAQAYDFSPDLLIVIEHLGNSFQDAGAFGAGAHIVAQAHDVGIALGGAVVNNWTAGRRSFTYWDDLGYWADAFFHPSDAGAQAMADPVIALLIS